VAWLVKAHSSVYHIYMSSKFQLGLDLFVNLFIGDMADLVFVFFDPMGQALCKRTLNIVEKLWAFHSDKIRLYLAKADEAGSETDRQR